MSPEPEPEAGLVTTGRPAAAVPDVAAALIFGAGGAASSRSDARRFFGFGGRVERWAMEDRGSDAAGCSVGGTMEGWPLGEAEEAEVFCRLCDGEDLECSSAVCTSIYGTWN